MNFHRKLTLLVVLGLAALAGATAAVAGNVTATATVTGAGALGLSHGATASVSNTLDGSDQTVLYTIPLTLDDARGNGAGWNTTITSTTFTTGGGTPRTLPGASAISAVSSTCRAGGTCTAATNSIGYPVSVPDGATAPAAVKFFNSAANTGMGRFTVTPTIGVTILGNAYAGSYSSTVTVAVVSGP